MDGFILAGGLGSLVAAGLCYSAYRNIQDVASHLRVCMKSQHGYKSMKIDTS